MSKWNVKLSQKVKKTISELPKEIRRQFSELVNDFKENGPFPENWQIEHLHGSFAGFLKVRIGCYRVIYCYESKIITVFIEKFGHRKDIYRRYS